MGLDNCMWDGALRGLLVLVPNGPGKAAVYLDDWNGIMTMIKCSLSIDDGYSAYYSILAEVKVCRPSAGQNAGPPLVHIESIILAILFSNKEALDALTWDAL
ncbi:uncharacterized protein PHACADRAFT_201783 [Phanerochaete carnosa HHB-10118-sp]|uniref:Uncharacterized protein n=1 Tax=Phanerochaete carnosa (strain HHB-10118-sp) TaxID=650164 RepID=K5VRG3_PHACS|nr:uncharacterized protein PHACADRAFT_201783 [Phanerochaete carnosa HHB-10118-sp]EKM49320.1 hypothetical protein PHACADRAFT_201783 [Phanerochaete carnosa HHB-10118-sp]